MPSTRENKSCFSCGASSGQLFVCNKCYLATYCSQTCCNRDWKNHKEDCKFVTWQRKHSGSDFCHSCLARACPHSKNKLKRCGGCLRVSYCSRECQTNDWLSHSPICTRDKNRTASENTMSRQWLHEIIKEEEEVWKREDEEKKNGGAKKKAPYDMYEDINDPSDSEDSPFTKEQRLQMKKHMRAQNNLIKKYEKKKEEWEKSKEEEDCLEDDKSWEKMWRESKTAAAAAVKGKATKGTQLSIKLSSKHPKTSESQKTTDNTDSLHEEEVIEKKEDGTYVIRKRFITTGFFDYEKKLQEMVRDFGQEIDEIDQKSRAQIAAIKDININ